MESVLGGLGGSAGQSFVNKGGCNWKQVFKGVNN